MAIAPAPGPEPRLRRAPAPFPSIPAGVEILPFAEFKECGIRMPVRASEADQHDDGVERDAHGIPTIPLRAKHDTDVSKTIPNKKRTPREWAASRPNFRKEWWLDWAEGEDLRNHGPYSAEQIPVDRLHQAASDFQKYRKFPPYATKVQYMWDQFRIFAGLLGTTPIWHNVSENPKPNDDEDDEDGVASDFDDEQPSPSQNHSQRSHTRFAPRARPRAPYAHFGQRPTIVHSNDEVKALLDGARAEKEARGLAWEDRHLINAPHLLRFFIHYLLRNAVFVTEPAIEQSLRACLPLIEQALLELPRTATIGRMLPDTDGFTGVCRELFDLDADGMKEGIEELRDLKLEDDDPEPDPSSFTVPTATTESDAWAPSAGPSASLFAKLGPTAFPLTHEPGAVERSVRRVVEVLPPKTKRGMSYPMCAATAVEDSFLEDEGLGMWRVVLDPWLGWSVPTPSSSISNAKGDDDDAYAEPKLLRSPTTSQHAPTLSRITLLVDGAVARTLVAGMGMGGTWVQLARQGGANGVGEDEEEDDEGGLWYCDDLNMVLPSFWVAA
ncbi:hypothetical protein HMN09_00856800 [Mycena chlorophos]|uniref:Uncharacterized protein n=1 Tax=Mycena chlorophos TaxID=658473 RepID=A0A8H6STP9_MYCCL|nr:hypothetical protein HMN09_00856800 [Mycena chlorophos]